MRVNPFSSGPIYIQDPNFVITVPADVLAPNGARPSPGTVLTENLDMFSFKFRCLLMIPRDHFVYVPNQ